MDKIIGIWKHTLFMQPLFELVMLATFVFAVRKRNDQVSLRFFPYYLGAFLVSRIILYAILLDKQNAADVLPVVNASLNYVISFIEYITFFWFIYHEIRVSRFKPPIWFLGIMGSVIFLHRIAGIYPALYETGMYRVHSIYVIESVIVLALGCFYMASLFFEEKRYELQKMPAFWIYCGIMVYIAGSLPIRLLSGYFFVTDQDRYRGFFAGVYFCNILLMAMLIKGYQCLSFKPSLKKQNSYGLY